MSKRRFNLEFQVQDSSDLVVRRKRIPFGSESSVRAFREEVAARSGWRDFDIGVKFDPIGFLRLYDDDQLGDVIGPQESMCCSTRFLLSGIMPPVLQRDSDHRSETRRRVDPKGC
jgi:hypothetical protein